MEQKARKMRLVSTYWIKDPILFAEHFTPRLAVQRQFEVQMTRLEVKEHRRRNSDYPYRITLTSQVQDVAKAIEHMQQNEAIGVRAGIQRSPIDNTWYT